MRSFEHDLKESQANAELPRWSQAYEQYFAGYQQTINADTVQKDKIIQQLGVDHIVVCDDTVYWVDFMLRSKPSSDVWLEIEAERHGKTYMGKFLKEGQLCTHIAYSFKPCEFVLIWDFQEIRRWLLRQMYTGKYERKTVASQRKGQAWESTALIVPYGDLKVDLQSFRMLPTPAETPISDSKPF